MNKKMPVIDLHQDLLIHVTRRELYSTDHWQTDFAMLKKENFKLTVSTAFPVPPKENFFDPISNVIIEADFEAYQTYCRENSEWSVVKNVLDLDAIFSDDSRHGL